MSTYLCVCARVRARPCVRMREYGMCTCIHACVYMRMCMHVCKCMHVCGATVQSELHSQRLTSMVKQVACGMAYLAELNFVHRQVDNTGYAKESKNKKRPLLEKEWHGAADVFGCTFWCL